jgi:hypothetical protein
MPASSRPSADSQRHASITISARCAYAQSTEVLRPESLDVGLEPNDLAAGVPLRLLSVARDEDPGTVFKKFSNASLATLCKTPRCQQSSEPRTTHQLVAIEVWDASTRLPANLLDALPAPEQPHTAAA